MKTLLRRLRPTTLLLPLLALLLPAAACAQFSIGMRDARYGYVAYRFCRDYSVAVEHSIYSEKMQHQRVRAYVGYHRAWGAYSGSVHCYASRLWNGDYTDYGLRWANELRLLPWLAADANLLPHHDSDFGFKLCYSAGLAARVHREVEVLALYSTEPEYRMSEKRLRAGLRLRSGSLSVEPAVSVAVEGKSLVRALCSFNYTF